jgi:hypothetical protein
MTRNITWLTDLWKKRLTHRKGSIIGGCWHDKNRRANLKTKSQDRHFALSRWYSCSQLKCILTRWQSAFIDRGPSGPPQHPFQQPFLPWRTKPLRKRRAQPHSSATAHLTHIRYFNLCNGSATLYYCNVLLLLSLGARKTHFQAGLRILHGSPSVPCRRQLCIEPISCQALLPPAEKGIARKRLGCRSTLEVHCDCGIPCVTLLHKLGPWKI